MRRHFVWLGSFLILGCHTFPVGIPAGGGPPDSPFRRAQAALRAGTPDQAIDHLQQARDELTATQIDPLPKGTETVSPRGGKADVPAAAVLAEPVLAEARNHLALAAAFMDAGEPDRAGTHLAMFLQVRPEHRAARLWLAELQLRLERPEEAACHFDLAIQSLQEETRTDWRRLVHCHGRMVELAEKHEDAYQAHLHRGIGLYLLALSLKPGEEAAPLSREGLLCKAAGELVHAADRRPTQARPCWYLHQVWRALGQDHQARTWLRRAQEHAPFSELTPVEQSRLELAGRRLERL